jgi:preprotein translocase subunit SecG
MSILVIVLHIIVCIALIMIVLLQTGKGADMGAAFGGGSSQTLFGSSGASTFLSKATTVAAVVFMLTSLTLAYMSGNQRTSTVMENAPAPVEQSAPAPSDTNNSGTEQPSAPAPAPAPTDSN